MSTLTEALAEEIETLRREIAQRRSFGEETSLLEADVATKMAQLNEAVCALEGRKVLRG